MIDPTTNKPLEPGCHHPDSIVRDAETREQKTALMKRLKSNALLNSMSKVAAFIAGPVIAFGLVEFSLTPLASPASGRGNEA